MAHINEEASLPIRLLQDRLLVKPDSDSGDRLSGAGIVIPATVAMGRRLAWGCVVAVGASVRHVKCGDRILYEPEDRAEVELDATRFILLRERDVHAIATQETPTEDSGLYL